jgi:heme/copper-type cytochrome/quinol oxidase subunit 2
MYEQTLGIDEKLCVWFIVVVVVVVVVVIIIIIIIIIIISNLSYDRSTASSKTIPPLNAI